MKLPMIIRILKDGKVKKTFNFENNKEGYNYFESLILKFGGREWAKKERRILALSGYYYWEGIEIIGLTN